MQDIPAYHLAYGTPARVIRRIAGPGDRSVTPDWKIPAQLHPPAYRDMQISRHEIIVLEMVVAILVVAVLCLMILIYLRLSSA